MATIQQLSEALQNAHAAGDTAAAQQLAQTLKQLQQQPQAAPTQPQVAPGSLPVFKVDQSQDADLSAGRVGQLIKSGAYDFVSNTADAVATGLDQYYGDQFQGAEDIARGIQEDFEVKQRVAIKPLLEAEGMADVGQSTLEYLAQSSPEMAAVMGGYAAGSRASAPLRKIPRFGKILNFMGGLTGGTVAAVGSFTGRNLDEFRQVQGREPTQDEMDNVVGTAVVQSALNSALAPLVMAGRGGGSITIDVVKRALQGTALEGSTEAAQEVLTVLQANNFDPQSLDDPETVYRLKESFLAGMAVGGPISAASSLKPATKPSADGDAANATLAQRLDKIASANGYNLKDIDKMSTEGARETVDAAHIQIAEELKQLRAELKARLQVDNRGVDDFDTLMDKIEAAVAFRQARNKTKSRVGQQEYDAVERLVGDTFEGQQILKKFREMNALTKLHNDGYQGGLSKFTDQFGIFGSGIGYDKGMVAMERLARPVLSGGLALQTGGASLVGQAAAQATGRAVDAVTGRRSRVDRFVNQNVGGDPINVSPFQFPSVRAQRQAEQAELEEEMSSIDPREAPMGWRNSMFGELQQSRANQGLPPIVFENTDIDQAVNELRDEGALSEQDLADINEPMGRIRKPTLAKITNRVNRNTRDRTPPQTTPAPDPLQQTRDAAREAAIQRGIEDNRRALDGLNEQVQNDNDMSKADKAKILAAMQEMRLDLGSDPVGKLQRIVRDLLTSGVPQPLVEKYVQPYVARVLEQQSQNRRGGGDDISINAARVVPVPRANLEMQENLGVDPVLPGGNYIDLDNTDGNRPLDITGNTYDRGSIKITPDGRPEFITSDNQTDSVVGNRKVGKKIFVNLAKAKTGWKWVEAPETGSPETIVSVTEGNKHFYALGVNFNNPVTLETYPDKPSEPRLRPTTQGELRLGKRVGSIDMRTKIHPVYEVINVEDKRNNPMRVSPSRPDGAKRVADPLQEDRQIGLATIEEDPVLYDKIEKKVSKYVGLKDPTIPGLIEHAIDNLRYLYNSVSPEYRERARKWYVGANKLSQSLADQYDLSLEAVAGVMASLSPQKDWYMNYDLGVRTINVFKNEQDTVFDEAMRDAFVRMIENKQAKRSKKAKSVLYDALAEVEGKSLKDIDPEYKGHFIRFFDEVYNPEKGHRVVTPEGELADFSRTIKGEKSGTAWNGFRDINKAVSIIADPTRENINDQLGEKHKVRSFYNNILDPFSPQGDVTIDTHAVAAALLRPLSGKSVEVLENFKDAGTSKNIGAFGSYGVYAEAYRRLANELGIQPRELQSITWEAVRGLFNPTFKSQEANVKDIDDIWKKYADGTISIEEARSQINDQAGSIDRAEWEVPFRPNDASVVEARVQADPRVILNDGLPGRGSDGRNTGEPTGLLSQATQEINIDPMAVDPAQMEFDLDVQSIPRTSDTEAGAAQRAVKENLDEANALIEIGKPGSKYENGIKTQEQLEALATALGVMNKLVFVDSFNDMRRKYESMTGDDPRAIKNGMMGATVYAPDGEILAVLVLKQGKGGKNYKQDQEFLTAVHEVAHVIENRNVSDSNTSYLPTEVSRPYKTNKMRMSDFSFRGQLNMYLAELGRDKRVFDNDPIVKEIREIQMNETATQPDGSQGPLRPSLRNEEFYGKYFDDQYKTMIYAKGAKPFTEAQRLEKRKEYIKRAMARQRKTQESYYENAAEFAVDPIIFALMEPKRAKENYPNVYKFIQDTFAGKKMYSEGSKNTSPLRFYANPFSIILAAVLSAMAMGEEEERRQPPMMQPGALTPQPGALTL